MNRILLLGVPRSGTTWISHALSRSPTSVYIQEPDNFDYPALLTPTLRRQLGSFPVVSEADVPPSYAAIWDLAFAGRFPRRDAVRTMAHGAALLPGPANRVALSCFLPRREAWLGRGRNVIVKSVHAPFAAQWIGQRYSPRVVVVRRNLLNVVASWLQMGFDNFAIAADRRVTALTERLGLPPQEVAPSRVARAAWEVGILAAALEHALISHPEWHVVQHEDLCNAPTEGIARLCASLGLEWSPRIAAFLAASDRPGSGYETNRVAGAEPGKWKRSLAASDVVVAREALNRFSFGTWALG
jgi:Sulfotransferase family